MYSRSAKGGEKGNPNRNPWLAKMALHMITRYLIGHFHVIFKKCYTYVGELKMAAPSEEKLICDKFNLEALTVNQVKVSKL
jgi:hypothetical protein